jgi:acyl-CoA-binding protein
MYDKQKSNGELTFEAIYTSVWVETGEKPDDMTIYQMYALFSRIGQFKNYDTTTLYNTVSGEVKIDAWYKHINLLEKEDKKTTLEEFCRNATQYK